MTRKDYEKAAAIVRSISANVSSDLIVPLPEDLWDRLSESEAKGIAVWTTREAFVTLFASDNPRFDADRFRAACVPVW